MAKNQKKTQSGVGIAPPRLLSRIRDEIVTELMTEFGYTSVMGVPRLDKVVINIGMGEALQNARAMESASADLARITGQKHGITVATQSIPGCKRQDGMA